MVFFWNCETTCKSRARCGSCRRMPLPSRCQALDQSVHLIVPRIQPQSETNAETRMTTVIRRKARCAPDRNRGEEGNETRAVGVPPHFLDRVVAPVLDIDVLDADQHQRHHRPGPFHGRRQLAPDEEQAEPGNEDRPPLDEKFNEGRAPLAMIPHDGRGDRERKRGEEATATRR